MHRRLALALLVAVAVAGCAPTKAELRRYAAIDAKRDRERERVGAAFIRRWQERGRPDFDDGGSSAPAKPPSSSLADATGPIAAFGAALLGIAFSKTPINPFFLR